MNIDPHDLKTLAAERVEGMRKCGLSDREIIWELATSAISLRQVLDECAAELYLARQELITCRWKIETLIDCEKGI